MFDCIPTPDLHMFLMCEQARLNQFNFGWSDTAKWNGSLKGDLQPINNLLQQIMDSILQRYQEQIRTLQHAIKTQNDVLITKMTTVLNQATLDALQKLDENLSYFKRCYSQLKTIDVNSLCKLDFINYSLIKDEFALYESTNLNFLKEQISNSISFLQGKAENEANPQSSLQDVMYLLLKAGDLYQKNLKEALKFQSLPTIDSLTYSVTNKIHDGLISYDNRIGKINTPFLDLQMTEKISLSGHQIYDIFYIYQSQVLIATNDNDLIIYDIQTSSCIAKLDPLRYVPVSCIPLHLIRNQEFVSNQYILLGQQIIQNSGSEFDPCLYLYETYNGKKLQTYPGHERSIRYILQLGDINTVATIGRDSKIFFWNLIKGEPHQILTIPTMEVIDSQLQCRKQQLCTLGIDGKLCIIQLDFQKDNINDIKLGEFKSATIISLVNIDQTSNLSSILLGFNKIQIVSFSSGWLTGKNQIKVFEEVPLQASLKFTLKASFQLVEEVQQLNTFIIRKFQTQQALNQNQLIITAIYKNSGMIQCFQYPENCELTLTQHHRPDQIQSTFPAKSPQQIEKETQMSNADDLETIQTNHSNTNMRWNIKLIETYSKEIRLIKFGQNCEFEIYNLVLK